MEFLTTMLDFMHLFPDDNAQAQKLREPLTKSKPFPCSLNG